MSQFNPLDYPLTYTRPARIAPSTWLTHTPFAMFLVELLRPAVIVELGTQYGVSYCAFCQAVKALDLDTRCYAVDTWQGDAHAGGYGNEVIIDLKRHHDPLYSTFSHLLQSTFDEALKNFDNGTIDLLHIDGYHTYDAVKQDFTNWLPKLSERGVILFHDIHVKRDDFGVWKLWDELKVKYPHFDFSHGYGLGVLAVGKKYPPALDLLLKASDDLSVIKDFFFQLGLSVEKEQTLHELSMQIIQKEQILQSIINSRAWKLVLTLRRIRGWLLPSNSLRERFVQFLFKGLKNAYRKI